MDVLVPDIGDFKDVPVIEILVKPGDEVAPESPLVTLESDKATMDVPSPSGGVVRELLVKVGDKVSQGSPVARLEVDEKLSKPAATPIGFGKLRPKARIPRRGSSTARRWSGVNLSARIASASRAI